MANIINDSDRFIVQHNNGGNYTYSGANLRNDVNRWIEASGGGSGGGGPSVDDLQSVCERGANYNGTITADDVNVDNTINTNVLYSNHIGSRTLTTSGTIEGNYLTSKTDLSVAREGAFGLMCRSYNMSASNDLTVGGNATISGFVATNYLSVNTEANFGSNIKSNGEVRGNYLTSIGGLSVAGDGVVGGNLTIGYAICGGATFASANTSQGKSGSWLISSNGTVDHRAWMSTRGLWVKKPSATEVGYDESTSGTIKCERAYEITNLGTGTRPLRINPQGFIGSALTGYRRDNATDIRLVDTRSFIDALKAVHLYRFDQTIAADGSIDGATSITQVAPFVDDIEATSASSYLLSSDDNGSYVDEDKYSHFLFGVCKEQQQLIENLTARIEQLEADHASMTNNTPPSTY